MGYDVSTLLNPATPSGLWTYGQLPPLGPLTATLRVGTQAYTSDADVCTWTGVYWSSSKLTFRKRPFMPPGVANVQALMASAPTIAISNTNPLATGTQISSTQTQAVGVTASLSRCSVSRARNPIVAGTVFPNYNYVNFSHVSAPGGLNNGGNSVQIGVVHTGTTLVAVFKGVNTNIFCKVNDQYVSLTPTAVVNDGSTYYYSVTFGGAGTRRIDLIIDNILDTCYFGGFWIEKTATLVPAQVRGRTVFIIGDSYTASTGAGGQALGYPSVFAEYMGWDDVVPVGIGSTGLITPGNYTTYLARMPTDVVPYQPDDVIVAGFYNDNGSTSATFQAAVTAMIQYIQQALPLARITFFGPFAPYGVGYQLGKSSTNGFVGQRAAIAAAIAAAQNPGNILWVDPHTMPMSSSPQQTTLTSSPSANATTFTTAQNLMAGCDYQFADGSRCHVISISGTTATVDKVFNAQTSGQPLVQVGPSWLNGNGFQGATTGVGNADLCVFTDDVHPSPLGHLQLGLILGEAYAAAFNN